MKLNSTTVTIIISVLIIVGVGAFLALGPKGQSVVASPEVKALAQCLVDAKAEFYGAFWCPHCREQKTLFANAAPLLPYIECSAPNAKDTLQVCLDKKIENYPTWIFADGTRAIGAQSLEVLAQKTNCPFNPGQTATSTITVGSSSSAQ